MFKVTYQVAKKLPPYRAVLTNGHEIISNFHQESSGLNFTISKEEVKVLNGSMCVIDPQQKKQEWPLGRYLGVDILSYLHKDAYRRATFFKKIYFL